MKEIYFIDITKTGKDYLGKKDISLISNEQAVLESVMNILQTEPGTRPMNPSFGCNLGKYLFEPLDPITALSIQTDIEFAIKKFEERIEKLQVNVDPDEDSNTFNISIIFSIKVINKEQKLLFTLNKVR